MLHDDELSKVSVVGLGMATQTGVADRMFRALADAGINIEMITTSEIKISVLVKREQALAALRAVHSEFELDRKPQRSREVRRRCRGGAERPTPLDIVARLQRMEDLAIESVSLDETQAQMTLFDVPDQPGMSARIFEAVAAEGILVDTIVQSIGRDGLADISFTVPRDRSSKRDACSKSLSASSAARKRMNRRWQSSRSRASASAATRASACECSRLSPKPASTSKWSARAKSA